MYQVDDKGFFGKFGGAYVPEILYKCVTELQEAYKPIIESEEFKKEYYALLKDYVGRPSPLYYAKRMSEKYGCQLYLKREDLNHTGAHKINNTIGQILMAKKMGKTRIIAETGAGQHGVATATVCALMDMKCEIFMGATDVERQHTNVERMKMLGAKVNPVRTGNMTLSDACSEAIRDWCCHPQDTFYIVGSTMGPHPYPDIVAKMQSVISEELKWQLEEKIGRDYPDYLIACVGNWLVLLELELTTQLFPSQLCIRSLYFHPVEGASDFSLFPNRSHAFLTFSAEYMVIFIHLCFYYLFIILSFGLSFYQSGYFHQSDAF